MAINNDLLVQVIGKFFTWRTTAMPLTAETQTKIEKALSDRAAVSQAEQAVSTAKQTATSSAQEALTAVAHELGLVPSKPA
jgi:RPA family protein